MILCGFTKTRVYRGGQEKLIYRRELPKKGELGQFADLRGGPLGKKEGVVVFEREVIPQCTL